MNIERYTPDKAQEWDDFVRTSRNGTFLFLRDYMDYHQDRFHDHSLMYRNDKGHLVAVMAANECDGVVYSHQGLTYGGFITSADTRCTDIGELFSATISFLREGGFSRWYYKAIPSIYHKCPSEEDEYWLWRNGAVMAACKISSCIQLSGHLTIPMERRRRRGIKKAEEAGYSIVEGGSLDLFWPIMTSNLRARYDVAPVHTVEEMKLLQKRLPQYIESYICIDGNGTAQGGAVMYISNSKVVHVQYAHATPEGKDHGAIDLLYAHLMERYRGLGYEFFDIGNSNEDGGKILNESLNAQKEGFGGRGVAYKEYEIQINCNK